MQLDNLARQLQRETEAKTEAVQTLHRKIQQANDKTYASSNVIGQTAIKTYLHAVIERIQKRYGALTSGKASMDAATVVNHLKAADPGVLALITMKVCLDVLGKETKPQLQTMTTAIGKAVHTQIRLDYYYAENPDLYKQTERYFHSSTGTRQRATVLKRAFNKAGSDWERWPDGTNHKVGAWLLDCLISVTGWLEKETISRPRSRKQVMRYSQEFLSMRDTILAQAERLAVCQWPMLCPPVEWHNSHAGGYLTESIRNQYPLVRRSGSKVVGTKQGDIPLAMLNNLQTVAYRINPAVLEVARHCYEKEITIGKFKRERFRTTPELLIENPTDEQLKEYKVTRRKNEDHNAQIAQKNWRTSEVMYVANKYADEAAFWVPWSFDYRGRIYPLVTALSPQGTDFDKSLLYFTEEGLVDEWWLAFACSNTFGNDKLPMAARIQWTRDNQELIRRIGEDPIGTIPEWENVSEPWSFMAACVEWVECIVKGRKTSGLPIGIDATQSGIQHLSALTLDGAAAALVNCLPADQPQDGYRTVAEYAAKLLPSPVNTWLNRKVAKRTVMTTPYGVTRDSSRKYIRSELKDQGRDLSEPGLLTSIVKAIFDEAVPAVFPGPVAAMQWLQASALEILERQEDIKWTTPSGFEVVQDLRKSKGKRITTRLMGSRVDVIVGDGYADPDKDHHKGALAPNVVHALDASLIHLTFAYWEQPFTVIHDCVLGRSCDMEQMSKDIRMHFAEMYKAPVLKDWAAQVGVDVPDDLIKGTFDVEQVNISNYFFC